MRGETTIAEFTPQQLLERLSGPGVRIDLGAASVRFRSTHVRLAESMRILYGAFPLEPESGFADVTLSLRVRRTLIGRRLAQLVVDGESPFQILPISMYLPLLEWGLNWTLAHRAHAWLMLHAGVVARGDRALIMPAVSGGGKSTLTAALMCHGYRLLSDEFCAIDPAQGTIQPLLRPVCLKNASIPLVGSRWPERVMGPQTPGTHKGTIAHLAPTPESVAARRVPARPAFVVFPHFSPQSPPALEPMPAARAFVKLSGNAFNYAVLGEAGFLALTGLLARCRVFQLRYSSFEQAFEHIDALFAQVGVAVPTEAARR